MRAVSLWGAAAAAGAAAGPLLGGVLVDATGWQGLFWIDAVIAAACIPLTLRTVRRVPRPPPAAHASTGAGTVLVAGVLAPFVFALTKGLDLGLALGADARLPGRLGRLPRSASWLVERRVAAPLVDLQLLRNALLVGLHAGDPHRRGRDRRRSASCSASTSRTPPTSASPPAGRARHRCRWPRSSCRRPGGHAARPTGSAPGRSSVVGFVLLTAGLRLLVAVEPSWGYGASCCR